MKHLVTCALLITALQLAGQQRPWSRRPDAQSPEENAKADFSGKMVNINYSAPSLRGRVMLEIMKHDPTMPVWRAGAQDATLLHTDADLDIAGLHVPKGEYTLFINLADPAHWQLIVNKQIHQWGLSYDKSQDLGRVNMNMSKTAAPVEMMKWIVTNSGGNHGMIQLEWGDTAASVSMTVQ